MKRIALILAATGLFAALAVPAIAGGGDLGSRTETTGIYAGGDFGNLGATWRDNGDNSIYVFVAGEFQCDANGSDFTMPSFQKHGIDRVTMSLTMAASGFDHCVGNPPETVSFDVAITTDYVAKTTINRNTKILKGDGWEQTTSSYEINGSGIAGGIVQGTEITGWTYGSFSLHGYNEGGAPTTTIAP